MGLSTFHYAYNAVRERQMPTRVYVSYNLRNLFINCCMVDKRMINTMLCDSTDYCVEFYNMSMIARAMPDDRVMVWETAKGPIMSNILTYVK